MVRAAPPRPPLLRSHAIPLPATLEPVLVLLSVGHGGAFDGLSCRQLLLSPSLSPSQVGPSQGGPSQSGPSQSGPTQVGPTQVGPAQVGPAQGGIAQVGPAQVDSK